MIDHLKLLHKDGQFLCFLLELFFLVYNFHFFLFTKFFLIGKIFTVKLQLCLVEIEIIRNI